MAPRIRAATADTEIVTDGFSCREQIEHLTDREPVHIAHLLQRAIRAERG
jgi:Fe-S oxidoreductase